MNLIDSVIGFFSPQAGLQRAVNRQHLDEIKGRRYYEGGSFDRLTKTWFPQKQAGDSNDIAEVQRIRDRAHHLYGNNAYVNKAVRALTSRVYGYGMTPESAALNSDGDVYAEFRQLANELWNRWTQQCHSLGNPWQGGATFDELMIMGLHELVLSGEFLIRFEHLSNEEMQKQGLDVPLKLTLLEAERLVETFVSRPQNGEAIFRGIIFNEDGTRKAYRIYEQNPYHIFLSFGSKGWKYEDYPAEDFIHIFQKTRPGSLRGVSALTPILLNAKNLDSLIYNEVVASTVNSCFTVARKKSPLNQMQGLSGTASNGDNEDPDGNSITRLQPGTIMDLGPDESLEMIDPKRPNAQLDQFVSFIVRGMAAGLPCVKSSTISGDYRNSSFSSEKSNENDLYWEVMAMQNWFANTCLRPVYAQFIESAIMAGAFDELNLPPLAEMSPKERHLLCDSTWRGPTSKSLNPIQDETAISLAIANGTESVQSACAAKGLDWRKMLIQNAEVFKTATELGLPDYYVEQLLGANRPMAIIPNDDTPNEQNPKTNSAV